MIKIPEQYRPWINLGLGLIIVAAIAYVVLETFGVLKPEPSPPRSSDPNDPVGFVQIMNEANAAAKDCARKHLVLRGAVPEMHEMIILEYRNSPGFQAYMACVQANDSHMRMQALIQERVAKDAEAGETASQNPETPWRVFEQKDDMRNQVTKWTCTDSTDALMLGPPYGRVAGELCLRNSPRFGKDVILQIESGQFKCGVRDCNVSVKFGEKGAVLAFSAAEPSDSRSGVLFIKGYSKFLKSLRVSNTVTVEAEYFQAGYQTLTFRTKNLKWD